jgi:hypothetical protein
MARHAPVDVLSPSLRPPKVFHDHGTSSCCVMAPPARPAAVTGLDTSIQCLVGYTLAGPSRILVLGPDSSLGLMIAATALPLVGADGGPAKAVLLDPRGARCLITQLG